MLREMTGGELGRWRAYYELEPFGPVQDDLRAGVPSMLLYNANRGKNARPKQPGDFFPSLKRDRARRTTAQEQADRLRALGARWGRGLRRKGN